MFKSAVITLTHPICSCREQNLRWIVVAEDSSCRITCKTCGVYLHIPRDQFLISIKVETPYPGKPTSKVTPTGGLRLVKDWTNKPS